MVIKVGILGYNEGNGHPFSFSAIVNGYDVEGFKEAGWPVILNYLEKQPSSAFDFVDVQITHAWTQDKALTQQLCRASKITHAVNDYLNMINQVDAIIIARDDFETHLPLAKPFLEHGIPVFIDKPLTLNMKELAYFEKFLSRGQLMSTSGMRYAKELDSLRTSFDELGELTFIEGVVLNNLEKYGIHLLDALNGLGLGKVQSVLRLPASFEAYQLQLENNIVFNLSCLGSVGKTFHLSFYGTKAHQHFDLHDNFNAFKRSLKSFFSMIEHKNPIIPPAETLATMKLLYKAKTLQPMESITLTD